MTSESISALEDFLVPVPEEELKFLLKRFQEHLCAELHVPISLLYIADAAKPEEFIYEAGAGLSTDPTPLRFSQGEGFLGQAVKEGKPLSQVLPGKVLGNNSLSALVDVEEISILAIPLRYQESVEGLWVIAYPHPDVQQKLDPLAWQDLLYKWAAYLQSVRSRRYIQLLLEQSQLQNQELISREEELRQNLEELAVTQEEMRRTQHLMAERARWQEFVIDLFTIVGSMPARQFRSGARIFLAQFSQYTNAQAVAAAFLNDQVWKTVFSWQSRKAHINFPEKWHFSENLLHYLEEKRTCTTQRSLELGIEEGSLEWIVIPYFSIKGLSGMLLAGYSEPQEIEEERNRAFLYGAVAFFSSYERVSSTFRTEEKAFSEIAEVGGAELTSGLIGELKRGEIPWLGQVPLVQREAYEASFRKALEERPFTWRPPSAIASKEICVFIGDKVLRLRWP